MISLLGLSLFVLPTETDRLFAWTINTPLTAAFLGASYWAATALALTSAAERDWARGRSFAPAYLIAGVLLLWVTLIHLDQFHMDSVTGWAWLVLYAIFPPGIVILLVRQRRAPGGEPARTRPMPPAVRVLLGVQGAVMALAGAALTAFPEQLGGFWPWQLSALPGRAIGVFVLAQGVLVLTACREGDWGRVRPAMAQYVLFGTLQLVAVARVSGTLDWDGPGAALYLAFLVSVLLTAAYGARHALLVTVRSAPAWRRRAQRRPPRAPRSPSARRS